MGGTKLNNEIIHELLNYFKREFNFKLEDNIDLLECEKNILAFLIEKGQKMVQQIFDEIGTGYLEREITIEEKKYLFNGNAQKTIHGLFGPITYKRAYYLSEEKNDANYIPLDAKLGIDKKHTPALNYFSSLHTGKGPYQESLDHFHEIFRPSGINYISLAKAENMDRELGNKLETIKQQEIKEVFNNGNFAIKKENMIESIVCVQIDGTGIPHKLDPIKNENNRLEYQNISCREAKSASISEIKWDEEREEAHCINTTYVSAMEGPDEVFKRIYIEMFRRCKNLDEMYVVFVGDGAKWIYDRISTIVSPDRCVFILDYYHASERLAETTKALFTNNSTTVNAYHSEKSEKKYIEWESKMFNGNIETVISECREMLPNVKNCSMKKIIETNLNYFSARIGQMNYHHYRSNKFPIGSGTIESACKNVIGARFKQGGMRWAIHNSDAMLQIRCSIKSHRFYDDFKQTLKQKVVTFGQLNHSICQ